MADKIIDVEAKDVTNTVNVDVDPAFLIDCIDEVNILVNAHVQILETVGKLIQKGVKSGMKPDEAARVAVGLHKRAADKAKDIVPNDMFEDIKKKR